ncbi:hypothetical protein I6I99_10730 [Sphingobacterium multivorum]|nr:hypothetical protein [Sphingobacterium multivorum]QQT33002.1 hypothetical protein I6I99_10730 [Sphingobacterium multivorum]
MKKWVVAFKNEKFVDYADITGMSFREKTVVWDRLLNKHGHEGYKITTVDEEEGKQIIECHNFPEMKLLARVKVSHNTFDEQTAEFRRLRKKYPKCSVGYSQWRPGLTYFES